MCEGVGECGVEGEVVICEGEGERIQGSVFSEMREAMGTAHHHHHHQHHRHH